MSLSNYIIICDGRIDLALAKNGFEMIRAASRAATALVTNYGERLAETDAKPISDLQHRMMDAIEGRQVQPHHAGEMCDEMFALLDALEDKMES